MITGVFKGFFRTVFGVVGLIGGVVAGIVFTRPLGVFLGQLIGKTDFFPGKILAFIVIFSACGFAGFLCGWLLRKMLAAANLSLIDRLLGGGFGMLQGFIITGVLLILIHLIPFTNPWLESSWIAGQVAPLTGKTMESMPEDWRSYLDPNRWIGASRERILDVLEHDSELAEAVEQRKDAESKSE